MNEKLQIAIVAFVSISVAIALVMFADWGFSLLLGTPREHSFVFLSSRINDCEIAGGKYSLRWSSYSKKYEEECHTEMKEIKNF